MIHIKRLPYYLVTELAKLADEAYKAGDLIKAAHLIDQLYEEHPLANEVEKELIGYKEAANCK